MNTKDEQLRLKESVELSGAIKFKSDIPDKEYPLINMVNLWFS